MTEIKNFDKKVLDYLVNAFQNKKLAHAYLFVDQNNDIAKNTAYQLTSEIFADDKLERIVAGNHPDFVLLDFFDKSIKIDDIRMLKTELGKSPIEENQRVFVINHAENLTLNSANALLNLLEEPVAAVTTILITDNQSEILPTIISRTQIVNFTENDVQVDIENGTEITNLAQKLGEQLINFDVNSILTAKEVKDLVDGNQQEQYFLQELLDFADRNITANHQIDPNSYLMQQVLNIKQMRQQNVSFFNLLNYLIIQMKESR